MTKNKNSGSYPFEHQDQGLAANKNYPEFIKKVRAYSTFSRVSLGGARWKTIFDSLALSCHKLTKLGFTYYNCKATIIKSTKE